MSIPATPSTVAHVVEPRSRSPADGGEDRKRGPAMRKVGNAAPSLSSAAPSGRSPSGHVEAAALLAEGHCGSRAGRKFPQLLHVSLMCETTTSARRAAAPAGPRGAAPSSCCRGPFSRAARADSSASTTLRAPGEQLRARQRPRPRDLVQHLALARARHLDRVEVLAISDRPRRAASAVDRIAIPRGLLLRRLRTSVAIGDLDTISRDRAPGPRRAAAAPPARSPLRRPRASPHRSSLGSPLRGSLSTPRAASSRSPRRLVDVITCLVGDSLQVLRVGGPLDLVRGGGLVRASPHPESTLSPIPAD